MVGASYRQIHYWVSQGWIPGLHPTGPGHPWRWTPEHVKAARDIKGRQDAIRLLRPRPIPTRRPPLAHSPTRKTPVSGSTGVLISDEEFTAPVSRTATPVPTEMRF